MLGCITERYDQGGCFEPGCELSTYIILGARFFSKQWPQYDANFLQGLINSNRSIFFLEQLNAIIFLSHFKGITLTNVNLIKIRCVSS